MKINNHTRIICLFILLALHAHVYGESASKETVMIPMRDGVRLATDIYRLNDGGRHPVILYRTPYNKNMDNILGETAILLLNLNGYVYVAQDCRGRFASEGADSVFITDGWGKLQDGYDTIEWLVQQSWCDGNVGMFGGSATGITSYRAAGAAHPNLKAIVAIVAPSDFYREVMYPGGEFRKSICENWMKEQGSEYMIDYFLGYPNYSPFWDEMNLHTRVDSITAAIYHIGGWYDCFSEGPVAAYNALCEKPQAGPQKLIMGPWTHLTVDTPQAGDLVYPDAVIDLIGTILNWMEYWLTGKGSGILNEPNVRYYLMGDPAKSEEMGCEWVNADKWPPAIATPLTLYLDSNGSLDSEIPETDAQLAFNYDPENPVPTHGGNNLTIAAGPLDQREIGNRSDVLQFQTAVFKQPIRVEGYVQANLYVSSNCPDTDFTLKLIDVYPDGREMLVTDGIARTRFRLGNQEDEMTFLSPDEIVPITIQLPPTAIVFNSGHRIKIDISSGNYPRFEINPNTSNPLYALEEKQIATNTVHFSSLYPSNVVLPVVEKATSVAHSIRPDFSFTLFDNFPNPFNNATQIVYQLEQPGLAELSIFDLQGRLVKTVQNEHSEAGMHTVVWDGKDDNGSDVASGMYLYQLRVQGKIQTKKLLFIK